MTTQEAWVNTLGDEEAYEEYEVASGNSTEPQGKKAKRIVLDEYGRLVCRNFTPKDARNYVYEAYDGQNPHEEE